MANSFIPSQDGTFNGWAQNFVKVIAADPTAYGVDTTDVTELQTLVTDWETNYGNAISQRDTARAATVTKDQTRDSFEELIRRVSRQIQADPEVTDGSKADAGLPIHSTHRTPAPVPTTSPTAVIEIPNPHEHLVRLADSANPHRRSRPKGVLGCEVSCFVGDQHPTDNDFKTLMIATRMTRTVRFENSQVGETAWYRFRWVSTRGDNGPWSSIYTATITG